MNSNFKEVNVLQHLDYEVHPIDVKLTDLVLVSTGIYKPSVRIHTLDEMCLKNERCIENQALKIETISDDGLKLAILRTDRYIEIHAKYGLHSTIRIPSNGIDLYFNKVTAELLTLGEKGLYRFNLEQGRFMKEMTHDLTYPTLNAMSQSMIHGIIAISSNDNIFLYDSRSKTNVASIPITVPSTQIDFHDNGKIIASSNTNGNIILYDLRNIKNEKENYERNSESETTKLRFNGDFICISDKEKFEIYNDTIRKAETDVLNCNNKMKNPIESIELKNITSFDFKGGLFFIASEDDCSIKSYYSKLLGDAPNWCKYVENNDE